VASSWNTWGPIEGSQHPQASYLSPGQEVSFTFLCVGWYLAIQVLPIRITQERHLKLPSLDLIGGGGGHPPLSGPMERHLLLMPVTYRW
jgi:hypothetical protein